jgi:hypothetical protein
MRSRFSRSEVQKSALWKSSEHPGRESPRSATALAASHTRQLRAGRGRLSKTSLVAGGSGVVPVLAGALGGPASVYKRKDFIHASPAFYLRHSN